MRAAERAICEERLVHGALQLGQARAHQLMQGVHFARERPQLLLHLLHLLLDAQLGLGLRGKCWRRRRRRWRKGARERLHGWWQPL